MEVLLTGGAGFIGTAIARALLADGHTVHVFDQRPVSLPGVTSVRGDLRDPSVVADALRGVDAVCHQAAMVGLGVDFADAPAYAGANDLGTAVLLAAMARADVRRLVLAGSMVVYGEGRYHCPAHGPVPAPPRRVADLEVGRFDPRCPRCGAELTPGLVGEDAPADPRNVYAATKLHQEHLASAWARACRGTAVSLRYHNVYGPGLPRDTPYAGVAALFRSALARGRAPRVFEDGAQRRDFVHVRDVASANLAALASLDTRDPGAFRAYNVGSGEIHTVGDLASALAAAYGGPAPVVTGEFRLGDVRHITADSRRLRAELGWAPRVSFTDGMAEFAAEAAEGAEAAEAVEAAEGADAEEADAYPRN
ncbi:NAD-dependent epimerase/dehydratase family protein [Streptacidiphilus jiangxiensis]|uniref:dTDP-L-rhamnose 4-epimerase n=1 Tax=Streptacidiphilus jiangxiensis TaxID=235985 RepID=A0A1H7YSM8_STRJI|nr:NAD-dependent epimerase/dehydratase family protein [Streptacidiphilus jiangxiensis]SEM48881.1 dTDP-L-rhamnose 4-epimerase [Streptacidiphilus jiangxiensis]